MRRAWVILLLLFSSACLDEYDVEEMTYPCRGPEDCVEDYECHPTRWICVQAGTSSAASALDAGRSD